MNDTIDPQAVPAVLISGTPVEVGRFLVSALWRGEAPDPTVGTVTGWMALLQARGAAFVSHASACRYWLFERPAIAKDS